MEVSRRPFFSVSPFLFHFDSTYSRVSYVRYEWCITFRARRDRGLEMSEKVNSYKLFVRESKTLIVVINNKKKESL